MVDSEVPYDSAAIFRVVVTLIVVVISYLMLPGNQAPVLFAVSNK